MSKAVKFVLYVVLITAVIDLLVAGFLNIFENRNRYGMSGGNINYYIEQENPDVLIMGSSRAHHYVIPDSLGGSAFNLSHNGMGIGFQACLVDVISQADALPNKFLLLEIEPEEFVIDEKPLLYDVQFMNRYYRRNKFVREQINRINNYEFLKYTFRSFPLNGNIPSLAKNTIKTFQGKPTHNGYSPAWQSANDSIRTMITAARRRRKDYSFERNQRLDRVYSDGLQYLRHVMEICRDKNVELILFTTPYYSQSERFVYQEDLLDYFDEMNIKYIDFTAKKIQSLEDPWLWVDNSHINHKGAQIFSGLLSKKFEEIKMSDKKNSRPD